MTHADLPRGVGWTALMTAYARAQESRRADRLFNDPWARAVIAQATRTRFDEAGLPPVGPATDDGSSELWTMLGSYFVIRTPFYDAQVSDGVGRGCAQVVLLAAGFDGRAQRLDLPGSTTVFEVDSPEVLEFKNAALAAGNSDVPAPSADRRVVPADLREDWPAALREAGFDPARPTVWLVEGLLMYFDGEQSDRLLATITGLSAPGSRFATEWFERNPAGEPSLVGWPDEKERQAGELLGSLFKTGPTPPPRDWLTAHGWTDTEIDHVGGRYPRHGRTAPWVFDPEHPEGLRVHLVAGDLALPAASRYRRPCVTDDVALAAACPHPASRGPLRTPAAPRAMIMGRWCHGLELGRLARPFYIEISVLVTRLQAPHQDEFHDHGSLVAIYGTNDPREHQIYPSRGIWTVCY
jgi:methyltransferase (TIGR00027 family)